MAGAKKIIGVLLIGAGIVAGFIPLLQGWMLIIAGAVLLEYAPAIRFADRIKRRWNKR